MNRHCYLGLDCGTQSLTGVLIDAGTRRVVAHQRITYDDELSRFGTRDGQLPDDDPRVGQAPPLMWAAALDLLLERLVTDTGDEMRSVRGVAVSGQQHGSVYLNAHAEGRLAALDPGRPLELQLRGILARPAAQLWTDSTTGEECAELRRAVGGGGKVAELTGSDAFERFTGPQILRIAKREPAAWEATVTVALVSSFLTSILSGRVAPIDHGDGSGMNLMNIRSCEWSDTALDAVDHGVRSRLPPLVSPDHVVGPISAYFGRYGLEDCQVVVGTGDNASSLVGVGAIASADVTVSLGTSDTFFGVMPELRVQSSTEGHVFVAPTGDYFCLLCFRNGSPAREWVRRRHGLDWRDFEAAVARTAPGNEGRILIPWFEPEIVPRVPTAMARSFGGLDPQDPGQLCRAVLEGQFLAMRLHSRRMASKPGRVLVTGGASRNRTILQIIANVFQCPALPSDRPDSAALGAALRAYYGAGSAGGEPLSWATVVEGFGPSHEPVQPEPYTASVYARLLADYESAEASALSEDPGGTRV